MRRPGAVAAWGIAAVVALLVLAYPVLYLSILPYPFQPYGFPGGVAVFGLASAVFGALVASRQPRNPVGWILLATAVLLVVTADVQIYAIRGTFIAPGSLPAVWLAAWLGSWLWAPGVVLPTVFLPLLLPDGRLESRGARALGALCAAALVVPALITSVVTFPAGGPLEVTPDGQIGGAHSLTQAGVFQVAYALIPLVAAAALARMFVRFRRATGELRQQLKWFALALGVVVVGLMASAIGNLAGPQSNPVARAGAAIFVAGFLAIPVGAGVSVLKYRLYDVDIVISRTFVYGAMALLITGTYVAIVVGVGSLVGSAGNLFLSIVATALVALAFQPVRGRLQGVANRLVYGKRATPYEVLSTFSEGIGETYADEDVLERMARLLAEATEATSTAVWVRLGDELRPAVTWPPGGPQPEPVPVTGQLMPAMAAQVAVPVRHSGELLGAISLTKRHGALTPVELKLVDDLARQAGLVMRTAGLTESLKQRLEELRASRQRLVAAQDSERRRIERNLHDGAQQHLVALKVKLGLLEMMIPKDPERAQTLATEVKQGADEALETLRDLARGIYPPLLAEKGLTAALAAQAVKATLPVTVDGDGVGRYPQEVEAAVYFCVLEALQNTQKYAGASSAAVRLSDDGDRLTFVVEDDGGGFDPATARRGSGLTNMADRLDALGGALEIVAAPGRHTRVTGALPALRAPGEAVTVP